MGAVYALGGDDGVKKDFPLGYRYLELSATQGHQAAQAILKCVACGNLDVHHMTCSRCRKMRYCDGHCQLLHWESAADPHKLHRVCGGWRVLLRARGSQRRR